MRIGQGFDTHRLVPGRRLVLGGLAIPHERGLEGHSDGDVLLHAVASALLGALGEGDLGRHFPSSDANLRGIASAEIVAWVRARVAGAGFAVGNLDATVIAEQPRLAPYLAKMEASLAGLLGISTDAVNVKVAASAVVLLRPRSNEESG
jgi:2-C-methyl-D-erythritol 2,4-cyclodiphosphate synthase